MKLTFVYYWPILRTFHADTLQKLPLNSVSHFFGLKVKLQLPGIIL